MFAPSEAVLKALLSEVRTIAVLGAKDKPGQPVDMVGRYLIGSGFTVHPVHPMRDNVWNLPTYKTLAEVPGEIDLIDVFRAPENCPEHAREALALPVRPKIFWMQSGIASTEARAILDGSGIVVVENRCLMVEHRRLFQMDDSIPPEIFDCQRCGDCCLGEGGIILDQADILRLAAHLSLDRAEFLDRCTELHSGRTRVRTAADGYCLFYDHGIRGCAVHPARPDICRAWPFFRGNLTDESSWRLAQDACPGIIAAAGHLAFASTGLDYLRRHHLLRKNDSDAPCALTSVDRDDDAE